jgi:hemerythrin-like domain-containing protein
MKSGLPSADPAPSFDDPLGMLFACHRRIERQLATLARLQRHLPETGCDDDARAAARAILKYFDDAAPNHHADEEQSVFPRLLALRPAGAERLVATLHEEHAMLADNWNRLRPLLAEIASGASAALPPADVAAVAAVYATHIAREDSELIPLARAKLDAAALVAIGREMADRRGVDLSSPGHRASGAVPGDPTGSLR